MNESFRWALFFLRDGDEGGTQPWKGHSNSIKFYFYFKVFPLLGIADDDDFSFAPRVRSKKCVINGNEVSERETPKSLGTKM